MGGGKCFLLPLLLRLPCFASGFVVLDGFEDPLALFARFLLFLAQGVGGLAGGGVGVFGGGSGVGSSAGGFFLLFLLSGEAGGALSEDGLDLGLLGRVGCGSACGRG